MEPQKYKNETQKIVHFRANCFCIFFLGNGLKRELPVLLAKNGCIIATESV